MKECTKCGEIKTLDLFVKGRNYCRYCRNLQQKKYISLYTNEQKQKRKESQEKWNNANYEKVKITKKRYKIKHREKVLKSGREYYNTSEVAKLNAVKQNLKKQIGGNPPSELVEVKLLILKTKRLCKTSKNLETI